MEYRRAAAIDAPALAAMNWQLIRDEGHRNPMTVAELTARMAEWLDDERLTRVPGPARPRVWSVVLTKRASGWTR